MKRVLIGTKGAAREKLSAFLRQCGYSECASLSEADAAVYAFAAFDDCRAHELARIAACSCAGVLVLMPEECLAAAESATEGAGIFFLPLGTRAPALEAALGFACKTGERLRRAGDRQRRLEEEIDDLKLVDRAKCALVRYLNMTEPDAHRFIEKQAMNKRAPRRAIALEILSAYES